MAEDIRETVGDGFAEGKNSREIAQDIAEQGDLEAGWGGAERIARQELHPGDSEPGIGCRCVTQLVDREDVDDADYGGDGDAV